MKYHIISIGVGKYDDCSLNLTTPELDATDFYNFALNSFDNNLGINELLVNENASLSKIQVALGNSSLHQIDKDDCFIFYFSGHWARSVVDDTLETFLVPYDVNRKDISNSCITVSALNKYIEKIPAEKKVLFIDSCYSWGAQYSKGLDGTSKNISNYSKEVSFEDLSKWKGALLFTASTGNEEALAISEWKYSLFTYYLLEELTNNSKKTISLTDIQTPISTNVLKYAKDKLQRIQTPCMKSDVEWTIIFPVFRKIVDSPIVRSEWISYSTLKQGNITVPMIKYDDKEVEDIIKKHMSLIYATNIKDDRFKIFEYKTYLAWMITSIQQSLQHIHQENKYQFKTNLQDIIVEVQNSSLEFLLFASMLIIFWNDEQWKIFCQQVGKINNREWEDRHWLQVLFSLQEIIYGELLYLLCIFSFDTFSFTRFKLLAESKIDSTYYNPRTVLLLNTKFFFWTCFWWYGDKTMEHIKTVFTNSFWWICGLLPWVSSQEMLNKFLWADFIVRLYNMKYKKYHYAYFWRWYGERIKPLIEYLLDNTEAQQEISNLLSIEKDKLFEFIKQCLQETVKKVGGVDWSSITSEGVDQIIKNH